MAQHVAQGCLARPVPADLAFVRSAAHAVRQWEIMVGQVLQHATDRTSALEQIEYQVDRRANLFVRVKCDLARWAQHVATWQPSHEFATQGLGTTPLMHARFEDVQLCLRHRALQTQQHPVVKVGRVVHTIRIRNEGIEQRAHLQQLMPIPTRTRQT
jgi:hypothetical protein